MAINAGYMGVLNIGEDLIRFDSASVSAKQEVVAPDMVMGDYDRDSFYYGKISIDGNISGPCDEDFNDTLWNWATTRNACGLLTANELDLYYYCGTEGKNHLNIPQSLINNLRFSATAGEVAQFSVDIIGSGAGGNDPVFDLKTPPTKTETKRLITWEKCGLTLGGYLGTEIDTSVISAFEINIANNVTAAYSLTQDSLWPAELIAGIRSITGSVTIYNVSNATYPEGWDDYDPASVGTGTITFSIGTVTKTINVMFHRVDPKSSVGPVTSTIQFTGVGHQTLP